MSAYHYIYERLTAALMDRLTHHTIIVELSVESFRFRHSFYYYCYYPFSCGGTIFVIKMGSFSLVIFWYNAFRWVRFHY